MSKVQVTYTSDSGEYKSFLLDNCAFNQYNTPKDLIKARLFPEFKTRFISVNIARGVVNFHIVVNREYVAGNLEQV
jgi:hypothetical protein